MDERIAAALARVYPHDAGVPARADTPLSAYGPPASWPLLAAALGELGIAVRDRDLASGGAAGPTIGDLERLAAGTR